jgi:glycosyltransferase 2 family protein
MSDVTSAITRAIRSRVGWSWVAAAMSFVIIAMAAVTLFKLSREIDIDKAIAALEAKSSHEIIVAGVLVAAGYIMLVGYDIFALRAIGWSSIPYRVASIASFTSHTIGHNLGAPVFTSNLLRYRIYSAWGLNVSDLARIAFVTGLTYCLGNAVMLGGGCVLSPAAASTLDNLPAAINRSLGILSLGIVAAYVLWVMPHPRRIGRSNWQIVVHGPVSALVQICIGTLDTAFVALAMYVLLPSQPAIGFADFVVIYVTAALIGVASYAPGSLGVLEAAMFIGLPQFRREELLASLLLFRVLYFVLPLILGTFLLGLRELSIAAGVLGGPYIRNDRTPAAR